MWGAECVRKSKARCHGDEVGISSYRMLYGKKVKFYFNVMGKQWRILRRKK